MPSKHANNNNSKRGRTRPSNRTPAISQRNNFFFDPEFPLQQPVTTDKQIVRQIKTVRAPFVFTTSTLTETFAAYFFTFADLADAAELGVVFDQYRIDRIDYKFEPNITESLSSTPVSGRVATVIDLDDANLLTSTSDALDYSNCQTVKPVDTIQGTFVPHFAYSAFAFGVFSSFANKGPDWIDCASGGVQHFGLKIAASTTTTAVTYLPTFRYHISLRLSH
jgi:hypothetical protein